MFVPRPSSVARALGLPDPKSRELAPFQGIAFRDADPTISACFALLLLLLLYDHT